MYSFADETCGEEEIEKKRKFVLGKKKKFKINNMRCCTLH